VGQQTQECLLTKHEPSYHTHTQNKQTTKEHKQKSFAQFPVTR
jgi:hypothetical protein